jgi:HEPN domain-containing protein
MDETKCLNFLSIAFDDYIAARLLLRNRLLAQGVELASTSVEKYIKAILALKKQYPKKLHLEKKLISMLVQHHKYLYDSLDHDFLEFLSRGYKLRYAATESQGFSLVINQYATLYALDKIIKEIDAGFIFKSSSIITPFRSAVLENDNRVITDNLPLGTISIADFKNKTNHVQEIKIGAKLDVLFVRYDTDGVNMPEIFNKKSDISLDKTQWQLALG